MGQSCGSSPRTAVVEDYLREKLLLAGQQGLCLQLTGVTGFALLIWGWPHPVPAPSIVAADHGVWGWEPAGRSALRLGVAQTLGCLALCHTGDPSAVLCAWDRPAGVCWDHGDFVPLLFLPFSLPSVCLSVRPFVCLFLCRRFFEGVSHSGSQTEIGSLHSQKGQDQESGSPVSYTTITTSCPLPSRASPASPQCLQLPLRPQLLAAPAWGCSFPSFLFFFPVQADR